MKINAFDLRAHAFSAGTDLIGEDGAVACLPRAAFENQYVFGHLLNLPSR
jgi:hypothetical protein